MKKLITFIMAFAVTLIVTFSSVACGSRVIEDIDPTKTNISVALYSGGYGTVWIDEAVERFEEYYAERSFEEGKTGVKVIVDKNKSYTGQSLATTVPVGTADIYFTGATPYYDLATAGSLIDITDLVTETVNAQDGKTIESKLTDNLKQTLHLNGRYYAIPLYEAYGGVSYDAGIFKNKNLYFSNRLDTEDEEYPGTNSFVLNVNDTKSCGPDGVYGTYDDGLPSTYMEFYKLMSQMLKKSVQPFVFASAYANYANELLVALFKNYVGVDGVSAVYNFNSNGQEIDVVTGFNGDEPISEKTVLVRENANKIKSSLGLYYATEFCKKVFSDIRYYGSSSTTVTHLNAMEKFMKSVLDGNKYIGMLIDGNWWYNEASEDELFESVERQYPRTYQQKEVRFMPLPHQYEGTVTPRDASDPLVPVLTGTCTTFSYIAATCSPEKIEAAKLFLSFCYGDEELRRATVLSNGVLRAVNYDFSDLKSQVVPFAQSFLEMREQAKTKYREISVFSNDPIFLRNQMYFSMAGNSEFWKTTVNGTDFATVFAAFHGSNVSAKDYFNGLKISDATWQNNYLR